MNEQIELRKLINVFLLKLANTNVKDIEQRNEYQKTISFLEKEFKNLFGYSITYHWEKQASQ